MLILTLHGIIHLGFLPGTWVSLLFITLGLLRTGNSSSVNINYFLVSEFSVLLFVLGNLINLPSLSAFALFINVGFPPFHFWLVELFLTIDSNDSFFIVSLANAIPIILLLQTSLASIFLLTFLSFLFSQAIPFSSPLCLNHTFLIGSFSNYLLIIIVGTYGCCIGLIFINAYIFILIIFWSTNNTNDINIDIWFFLNIIGVPPTPLFFLKLSALSILSLVIPFWTLLLIVLSSVMLLTYAFLFYSITYWNNSTFSNSIGAIAFLILLITLVIWF